MSTNVGPPQRQHSHHVLNRTGMLDISTAADEELEKVLIGLGLGGFRRG